MYWGSRNNECARRSWCDPAGESPARVHLPGAADVRGTLRAGVLGCGVGLPRSGRVSLGHTAPQPRAGRAGVDRGASQPTPSSGSSTSAESNFASRVRCTLRNQRSISVSCEPGVLCPSPQKGSIQNPDAVFAMIHRRLTNPPLGMHWTAHGRQPVCSCCKCVKFCDMRLDAGFPPDSPSQNIGAKRIHFAT